MQWVTTGEPTLALNTPVALTAGIAAKLPTSPVPELVTRINDVLDQVPPDAKSESNCNAANVPPGFVDEPPMVALIAFAAPEIVPDPLTDVLMCAPLIVPAAAAPAPVTTEKAR